MKRSPGDGVILPLAIALIAGVLAIWLVRDQVSRATALGGPPVTVLVASDRIEAGTALGADQINALVTERSLPSDYAPIDAINASDELIDTTLVASVDAGAVLTRPLLAVAGERTDHALRKGERAVSVGVRAAPDGTVLVAGDRVDLVASGFDGAARSEFALTGAQVLSANESGDKPGVQRLTLRVAAAQTAALVRADVFARELRAIKITGRGHR